MFKFEKVRTKYFGKIYNELNIHIMNLVKATLIQVTTNSEILVHTYVLEL